MTNNRLLETQMVKFQDLMKVRVKDDKECFVTIEMDKIPFGYTSIFYQEEEISGKKMYVREGTWKRLLLAQRNLQDKDPRLSLFITFGYRSLEIQTNRFLQRLKTCSSIFFPNPFDLYEKIHRSIAVPSVAGHPTGGAVDIVIVDKNTLEIIDFGGKQYDYATKNCYVFTNSITRKQKKNRMLLRAILIDVGFAPFDGEWWHFSYGDREWAFYYKQKYAIYNQISYADLSKYMVQ